jgi:hypothetical protein
MIIHSAILVLLINYFATFNSLKPTFTEFIGPELPRPVIAVVLIDELGPLNRILNLENINTKYVIFAK